MSRALQSADPRALAAALGDAVGRQAGREWRVVAEDHAPGLESVLAVGNG